MTLSNTAQTHTGGKPAMTEHLFAPAAIPAAPIQGEATLFPINRIFCVGRNYEAHAREMGVPVDREAPFYFTKTPSAYVPSGATVAYPPATENYHYEMELVVAIGKPAFRIARDQALDVVYGYACGLDMTRRDLQLVARAKQRPWDIGKDFEESAILSDIVPVSVCGHPSSGALELRVNGQTRQFTDLNLLIWSIPDLIAHLSTLYHLQPGDLIYTGTPEGVGAVLPGDRIEGSIAAIGSIALTIGDPA
jgi:fumarylpyruvate hydrolase